VLAYLVAYQNFTLHDAFFHTRRRRPVVTPNLGFMEKLCAYEVEMRHTETTISFESYKSWYSGDTVATEPKLAVSDGVTFEFEPLSRQTTPDNESSSQESPQESPRTLDSSSKPGRRSRMRLRFKDAARKMIKQHWLNNSQNETEIDLDLPSASEVAGVAQERIGGIKTLLLRYAAQDPELRYCQGMHLVAAAFTAASCSQGGSYFRFQAFVRSVRGLWLPGFPLLEAGLMYFAEVAKPTAWSEHLRAHDVGLNSCLSKVWLTMFTTWLPLPTLVDCLEFLEGHGLSGVLALTLALMDKASEDIIKADEQEGILEVLESFAERHVQPKEILMAVQKWLPKTDAAVSRPPQAPAAPRAEHIESPDAKSMPKPPAKKTGPEHVESSDDRSSPEPSRASQQQETTKVPFIRQGSRVVDEYGLPVLTSLPDMTSWIVCEAHEEKEKKLPRAARRLSWSMHAIS